MAQGRGVPGFTFQVPFIRLPGRGIDLALDLQYNSRVWLKSTAWEKINNNCVSKEQMVFDPAADWLAPGFNLGFGRIVVFGIREPCATRADQFASILVEPDGTRHPAVQVSGVTDLGSNIAERAYRTTDGSFIDYRVRSEGGDTQVLSATALYPNGTEIEYQGISGDELSSVFPTSIRDVHGNVIRIAYLPEQAPKIDTIVDTIGRTIRFYYEQNRFAQKLLLTAITAPGYAGSAERVLARFGYERRTLNLANAFSPPIEVEARDCDVPHPGQQNATCHFQALTAVAVPGAGSGFFFSTYYSAYGMLTGFSERRNMTVTAPSLDHQAAIGGGDTTRERRYPDYPAALSSLSDVPAFTEMVESWAGGAQPARYQYTADAQARTSTVVRPDGSRVVRTTGADGLLHTEEVFEADGRRLAATLTEWGQGDANGYLAPRVARVLKTDARGQTSAISYGYGPWHNQVTEVSELDYGGTQILRGTKVEYVDDPRYRDRHIFNLPRITQTYDGAPGVGTVVSRTELEYDNDISRQSTPDAVGRDPRFVKSDPAFDPATERRGLVEVTRRYADPVGLDQATRQEEQRRHDEAGNLVEIYGSECCESVEFSYEAATQYAWASSVVRGASDTTSPIRMQEAFGYDLNTGLVISHTDADGRGTTFTYIPDTLRIASTTLPAAQPTVGRPVVIKEYDDAALSAALGAALLVETRVESTPDQGAKIVAGQTVAAFDGLGRVRMERSRAADGAWAIVVTEYDGLGRVQRRSLPYREADAPAWITHAYDALGRITSVRAPGGGTTTYFYDEQVRPVGTSSEPGETTRVVDPDGRERWMITDVLGRIREVAEPDPAGTGSLSSGTPLVTRYAYGANYTQINQGEQESRLRFDGLGHLTHQALPGRDAVIDGPDGRKYSDLFGYDTRGNVIFRKDARGQGASFTYDDPLRRLGGISHVGLIVVGPPPAPGLPTPDTVIEYVTTGDLRRPRVIETTGVVKEEYEYDGEARLVNLTRSFADWSSRPLTTSYAYDVFGRVSELHYPPRFEQQLALRMVATYEYGLDGRPKMVRLDGNPLAADVTYDAGGRLIGLTLDPGSPRVIRETFNYGQEGRLQEQTISRNGQLLALSGYAYSPAGRLLGQTDNNSAYIRHYSYDALGRLRAVEGEQPATAGGWGQTYGYDRHGNRTTVQAAGVLGGAPIPVDGLAQLSVDAASGRIQTPGFGYDAAGNMKRGQRFDGGWQGLEYDQEGQLICVDPAFRCPIPGRPCQAQPTVKEAYRFGGDRRRVLTETLDRCRGNLVPPVEVTSRTLYVWDGNSVLAEYAAGAVGEARWTRGYVYLGDRLLATVEPSAAGDILRYHHPGLVHTRLITNSADDQQIENNLLPFGTAVASGGGSPGSTNRPFGTYDRSPATRLDYAVNRFYDSVTGRFIQPDPLGAGAVSQGDPQTLNHYAFVRNRPADVTDPLGLEDKADPKEGFYKGEDGQVYYVGPVVTVVCGDCPPELLTGGKGMLPRWRGIPAQTGGGRDGGGGGGPGGRNWVKILAGEHELSAWSWIHGGEFLEGAALMVWTTIGAAVGVGGGALVDALITPARPFANIGCVTCKIVGAVGDVYKSEFETFVEPSFPWQVGEAAVENVRYWADTFLGDAERFLSNGQREIYNVYGVPK